MVQEYKYEIEKSELKLCFWSFIFVIWWHFVSVFMDSLFFYLKLNKTQIFIISTTGIFMIPLLVMYFGHSVGDFLVSNCVNKKDQE